LTGEGWGEGELNGISIGYIPLPLIPFRPAGAGSSTREGKWHFYEFIKITFHKKIFATKEQRPKD
jgi:hypothetical protein